MGRKEGREVIQEMNIIKNGRAMNDADYDFDDYVNLKNRVREGLPVYKTTQPLPIPEEVSR